MGIAIMIDSGAFSAWTSNSKIDLDQYIAFCLENLEDITYIVNLDVIPGAFGKKNITEQDRENSAKKGYDNYCKMLNSGVPKEKLIHVFHQDENFKWLEKMVDEIPYIGLSPANDRATQEKIKWLDTCMNYVTDHEGKPIVKFHGFAVTAVPIMIRYPWYSVDSTTWSVLARHGKIIVPRYKNGTWSYLAPMESYTVSFQSEGRGDHLFSLPAKMQDVIYQYLDDIGYSLGESKFKTVDAEYKPKENEVWAGRKNLRIEQIIKRGVGNDYKLRDEVNIKYFLDLQKAIPEWPTVFKHKKTRGFNL